jgi:TraB/PrgY/gumN family
MSNLSDAQRALPTENVVDFVNRMPDIHLFETVYQILLPVSEKQPLQGRVEAGFLKEIVSKERKNNTAKQASIERSDEGYRAWSENCSQAGDTEALILEILDLTGNKSSESIRSVEEFLTEFRKNTSTTKNISSSYRKLPLESYTQRCAVKSRNLLWMKKIKEELRSNENTQPLMVVAGIGHVVGEFGLLSLLCKEGYCKAERVTQLN